ncbi:hypothetical protein HYC85_012571 [Camellia sinensis]|uniref:Small EDRK-rich factor-like N-terminal domain-containing protein n=1 Tax=Camellia sinensis TaxID=4442 RepID=A0A7J7HF83_CAMSI|nr:hypothetical protein HYC85_012571 [Camellia sinensis]
MSLVHNIIEHHVVRDRDRERAQARGTAKGKGKDDGLTPEQRRERDGKALQEKAAKKAAEGAGSGNSEVSVEIYESKSKISQILFLLLMPPDDDMDSNRLDIVDCAGDKEETEGWETEKAMNAQFIAGTW